MKYSHTKDRPRKKTLWRRDKCHYDTQGDIEVTTMSRTSSSNGDSDALDTAEKKKLNSTSVQQRTRAAFPTSQYLLDLLILG